MITNGKFSDALRTIIAYSAIDEGERPFGDTAIRALYNDANDLGLALAGVSINAAVLGNIQALSHLLVEQSAYLALNEIKMEDQPTAVSGVFAFSEENGARVLTLDYSNFNGADVISTDLFAQTRSTLFSSLLDLTVVGSIIDSAMNLWGANPTPDLDAAGYIDRIIFRAGNEGGVTLVNEQVETAAMFIGGSGADLIQAQGSTSNLLISGGLGKDVFSGGSGNDIIFGGAGTDTVDYSADPAGITIRYVTAAKTGTVTDGWGSVDTLHSIENFILTPFDDVVEFYPDQLYTSVIDGGDGTDTVRYLAGASWYYDPARQDVYSDVGLERRHDLQNVEDVVFSGTARGYGASGLAQA